MIWATSSRRLPPRAHRRANSKSGLALSKPNRSRRSPLRATCSLGETRCKRAATTTKLERCSHRGQQYSINAITNGGGAVTERYAYSAYGTPTIFDGNGIELSSSADNNRYTYTGREWDEALDLYHYRERIYDSVSGRFCSRDPIGYEDEMYALTQYCTSAPLNFIDWTGNSPQRPVKGTPKAGNNCAKKFVWMAPNVGSRTFSEAIRKAMKCALKKLRELGSAPSKQKLKDIYTKCLGKAIKAQTENEAEAIARVFCCYINKDKANPDPCGYGTHRNDRVGAKPRNFPCWDPSDPKTKIGNKNFCGRCCDFRSCVDGIYVILSPGKVKKATVDRMVCLTNCNGGRI